MVIPDTFLCFLLLIFRLIQVICSRACWWRWRRLNRMGHLWPLLPLQCPALLFTALPCTLDTALPLNCSAIGYNMKYLWSLMLLCSTLLSYLVIQYILERLPVHNILQSAIPLTSRALVFTAMQYITTSDFTLQCLWPLLHEALVQAMQLCRNVVNQYLNLVHGGNRVRHNLKPFRGAERIREEMPSASHKHPDLHLHHHGQWRMDGG